MSNPKFMLGQLVATPAALKAIADSGQTPLDFLSRHARGDWGDVSKGDAHLNDTAIKDGSRLLSAYTTLKGERIWVITEAQGEDVRRASTCILLPEEY
jgi:hypothetical protein